MKVLAVLLLGIVVLTGCVVRRTTTPVTSAPVATAPSPPTAGAIQTFRGEVWTWDDATSSVTLRLLSGEIIRVRISPEQLRTLRLHETMTVQGELAPPAEIPHITMPPPTLVPRGPADDVEVTGTVATVSPGGLLAVSTPRGPVQVWVTSSTAYRAGEPARVRMHVQPLEALPAGMAPPSPTVAQPAALTAAEPGDYAVVVGRITALDPAGRLTVESTRGPVDVWVPNAQRYRAGESVEVRTSVHPAR